MRSLNNCHPSNWNKLNILYYSCDADQIQQGSCQFFECRVFLVHKVGAMAIAILGEPIKPRQQVDDCGRWIRISVCSPSLYNKTSKPQIQSLGSRVLKKIWGAPFATALVTFFPPLIQNTNCPVGCSHCGWWNIAVANLSHLAWRHWRGKACRASAVLVFFLHGSSKSGPQSSILQQPHSEHQ